MNRLIALMDGTGMDGELVIFSTNAPKARLKDLEQESCQVFLDGRDYDEVPMWSEVLQSEGYTFDYIDSSRHVTPYGTSSDWVEDDYPEVTETYIIEDNP